MKKYQIVCKYEYLNCIEIKLSNNNYESLIWSDCERLHYQFSLLRFKVFDILCLFSNKYACTSYNGTVEINIPKVVLPPLMDHAQKYAT